MQSAAATSIEGCYQILRWSHPPPKQRIAGGGWLHPVHDAHVAPVCWLCLHIEQQPW